MQQLIQILRDPALQGLSAVLSILILLLSFIWKLFKRARQSFSSKSKVSFKIRTPIYALVALWGYLLAWINYIDLSSTDRLFYLIIATAIALGSTLLTVLSLFSPT